MKWPVQLAYDAIGRHHSLVFHHMVSLVAGEIQLLVHSWPTNRSSSPINESPAVVQWCSLSMYSLGKETNQECTAI